MDETKLTKQDKEGGGSSTYVISATSLQEIDDEGLLYKYENNV